MKLGERLTDLFLAVWFALVGAVFVVPIVAATVLPDRLSSILLELQVMGRYVYVVVVAVCIAGIAVKAVRRSNIR